MVKQSVEYLRNIILQSPTTGLYYFVPKAKVLDNGILQVVGKKVDVTESVKLLFGRWVKLEEKRFARLQAKRKKTAQNRYES